MISLSPSVPALRTEFGTAIHRHVVSNGQTIVYVERDRSHDVLAWLRDTPGQEFNYLTDVTAVDYRDPERPLEVVYQLRKDFPLRGHFSRAEQTRQALAANPEAHYSLEELSLADAYGELPKDMQERLARGERGFLK